MKKSLVSAALLIALASRLVCADFGGPIPAVNAASPDGNLAVRIVEEAAEKQPIDTVTHLVRFYEFDSAKDNYVRRSEFRLKEWPGELLFVSNVGDLVMVSLGESGAIRLYARDGKLVKTWNLNNVLTPGEIEACAKTGSTLQWIDEGAFFGRRFYFKGPSHRIRALQPPFTVMRSADTNASFSGTLDADKGEIRMNKPK